VLYSKGQNAKPGRLGQRSTDIVDRTEKNPAGGMDICVVCVCVLYSKDKGASRENQNKKKNKYGKKEREGTQKKSRSSHVFLFPVHLSH
jgi:hypothetical protein